MAGESRGQIFLEGSLAIVLKSLIFCIPFASTILFAEMLPKKTVMSMREDLTIVAIIAVFEIVGESK